MEAGQYQRVRLWSGITSIGWNLAGIIAAFWLAISFSPELSDAGQIALLAGLAVLSRLWNLPLDILSGHAMESALGRTSQPLRAWLKDWWQASLGVVIAMFFGMVFFWWAFAFQMQVPALGIAVLLIGVALFFLPTGENQNSPEETALKNELSRLGFSKDVSVRFFQGDESCPVNGYSLPFARKVVFLSSATCNELTPREGALLCARELWMQTLSIPLFAALISAFWLLGGVALGLFLPYPSALAAAVGGPACVSMICFLALFVWPVVNRHWMIRADQWLADRVGVEEVNALLEKVQKINATDIDLPAGKTAVFHPIPPLNDRKSALT